MLATIFEMIEKILELAGSSIDAQAIVKDIFQFAEVFLQMLNVNFNVVFIDAHG